MIEILPSSVGDPWGEAWSGTPVVGVAAACLKDGYGALDLPGALV